ncbi:hypothetical protein HYALB_00011402 [Hymenoscyphus albidus]|uniref:RING-type domain-containing protein n=1 Tax=Hymenoscyphus albidus TaxID=595503 RepID=A0A9N9LH05_9HELO|nr:hypothetical protein HYALB_00011402 [Hymenoscyphus albidus]
MRVISEVVMDHEDRPRGMDVDQDELHSFMNEKLDKPEILWEIKRRSDGYMEDSPFERLILDLVCREYEFEDALVEDHAEDILVDKQVAGLDIRDLTNQFSWINPEFFLLPKIQAEMGIQEHRVRNLLRRVQKYTRPRYGHRLFTDWQGTRPWAKLYQLYNTEGENEWAADGIRTFRETTLQNADDETPGHLFEWLNPKPTEPRRKAGKVLGMHPIDYSEQQRIHAAGGETHFPVLSACGVCIEESKGGFTFENTVALLPCGHLHHLKCIFEFWDMPGKYLHTCPTCGSAPKLNWQRVGLDVNKGNIRLDNQFVHNLEGYEAENATAYANSLNQARRALCDVPPMGSSRRADMLEEGPSRYWLHENTNALLYTTQRLDPSIPTWHPSKLGQLGRSGRFLESTSRRSFQLRDAGSYATGGGVLEGYVDEEAPGLSEAQRRQRRMRNSNVWERQVRQMREERLIEIGDSWVAGRRRRPRDDGTWENVSMPQNDIRNEEIVERSRMRERFRVTSLTGPDPAEVDYFVLPGARFPPEQESAFLRRIRRQKNAAARQKARVERKGLFGLYSKV